LSHIIQMRQLEDPQVGLTAAVNTTSDDDSSLSLNEIRYENDFDDDDDDSCNGIFHLEL
jgi:hypothetical protein